MLAWQFHSSSLSLVIHCTRLLTIGNWALLVAAAHVCNSLPQHVTSTQSLPVFCSRLKTHLFMHCFPWLCCCAWEVTSSFSDTLIAFLRNYLLTGSWFQCRKIKLIQQNIWSVHENFPQWIDKLTVKFHSHRQRMQCQCQCNAPWCLWYHSRQQWEVSAPIHRQPQQLHLWHCNVYHAVSHYNIL